MLQLIFAGSTLNYLYYQFSAAEHRTVGYRGTNASKNFLCPFSEKNFLEITTLKVQTSSSSSGYTTSFIECFGILNYFFPFMSDLVKKQC
jgi:hypothetical protein